MSASFAVVYEADADFLTATDLADRVLVKAVEWLDEDLLADQREWVAETADGKRLTWKGIKQLAFDSGIKARGRFDGEPGRPDAAAARRAILFLRKEFPNLNGIVLIRDQDDQPERRQGLEQARNQDRSDIGIVIGLAVVERECWVISRFDPLNETESARLEGERKHLGFDPRHRNHELTACKDDQAKRSPKRVLRELSGNNGERERRCWRETALTTLRERGGENGLALYLKEIEELLAGMIGRPS